MAKNENTVSYDPSAHDNSKPSALTVNELMRRWSVPRKRVLEAIHDGRLAAFKVGRRVYRVRIEEVERFEKARAA